MSKSMEYAHKLAKLVQKETIYSPEDKDNKKFDEFYDILKNLFPDLAKSTKWETIHGALLITWKGTDSTQEPYIFMNHCDVVEADGQWEHEPFSGDIDDDGFLWGRGTLDNKGSLFVMLQAADELIADGFTPERDIYFISGNDEEKVNMGAHSICEHLKKLGVHAKFAFDEGGLVTEDPVSFAKGHFAMISLGEKRSCDLKFIAKSQGGHTSMPTDKSPLVRLSKFVAEVKNKDPFKRKITPIIQGMFKAFAPHASSLKFFLNHPKIFGPIFKIIAKKSIPGLNAMMQTTIDFTMAHGSDAVNAVPQEAWIGGNIRAIHHQNYEESLEILKSFADKYDIEIKVLHERCKSRVMDPSCDAFKLAEQAVKETLPMAKASIPYLAVAATDLREIDTIADECIRFSPLMIHMKNMNSIHGPNEKVRIDCLEPGVNYYKYLLQH